MIRRFVQPNAVGSGMKEMDSEHATIKTTRRFRIENDGAVTSKQVDSAAKSRQAVSLESAFGRLKPQNRRASECEERPDENNTNQTHHTVD